MDRKEILAMLPEEPPKGLETWALGSWADNLGGELTIFSRESWAAEDWMDFGWWMDHPPTGKRHWAARCSCTACGEDYFGGWANDVGGSPAIVLHQGEDGQIYVGWCEPTDDMLTTGFPQGSTLYCPLCGAKTTVVHDGKLRTGRTFACQFGTVARLGAYGALLYWLLRRTADAYGIWSVEIWPRFALVLDERGRLHRFGHTAVGQYGESCLPAWEERSTVRDPETVAYYSHGNGYGQTSRNTRGAIWWDRVPDLTGTTMEKTGLDAYLDGDGEHPAAYLDLWRRFPAVENLVRTGWTRVVESRLCEQLERAEAYGGYLAHAEPPALDWTERKPHRMLHLEKAAYKALAGRWEHETAAFWVQNRAALKGVLPGELGDWVRWYGVTALGELLDLQRAGQGSLERTVRYLERQEIPSRPTRARLLLDYRRHLFEQLDGREPTEDQLFPPRLLPAHDRAVQTSKRRADEKLRQVFEECFLRYRALEWTDGELCVVVPQMEEDLFLEGEVLHHCVGGYGEAHTGGRPIFFIRHTRRPERSYFTLNEDLRGELPKRIQLHGYRNELYTTAAPHDKRIPKKVLDFCARWEKEILLPWFARERAAGEKTDKRRTAA